MDLSEFKEAGIEFIEKVGLKEPNEDFTHLLDSNSIHEWLPFWTRNAVENYAIIPKERVQIVTGLKNIHWGKEAAILFSGPSLDDYLPYLSRFKGIIFSGASTLNPCIANGINPDWTMIIDADEYVPKQFDGLDVSNLKTVLSSVIYPGVPKLLKQELIWWFNPYDPRHWFLSKGLHYIFPSLPGLLSASCVPGAMIRLAFLMGIRKMYLLGADFGFPGGRERCSIWKKENDKWVKGPHDPFCNDKSPREIYQGIETTMKLRISHHVILSIVKELLGLEVVDCSKGIMNEFPQKEFREVVNG